MNIPDLDSFSRRVTDLENNPPRNRIQKIIEVVRLIRWGRRSIRMVESNLAQAVQERTQRLEALGDSAAESPNEFLITGVFNFQSAIADLEIKRNQSIEDSAQLAIALEQERKVFNTDRRLLKARLAGLKAAELSLKKDAPAETDIRDPLAEERQKISDKIQVVSDRLDEVESSGSDAISKLESERQLHEERKTHFENRASAIRRDLGRALLEDASDRELVPEVQAASSAVQTVQEILELRRLWLLETARVDRRSIHEAIRFFLIFFSILSVLWLFFE